MEEVAQSAMLSSFYSSCWLQRRNGRTGRTRNPRLIPFTVAAFVLLLLRQTVAMEEVFFSKCTLAMYVADDNKDSLLTQNDYVALMNRLVTATRFDSFEELDPIFQDIYNEISSDNNDAGIDATGTEIGSSPAADVVEHLRSVCMSIHEAMQHYKTQQLQQEQDAADAEAESTGGNTESISNEDDFSDLTDQVYRLCKMAMYVADEDKDERLDLAEYVYFVSRLTYGSIQVESFDDLPVLFQTSHALLIDENGLINAAGTAPGETLNDAQTTRLKKICSIMDAAVQDNEDMEQAATEASTESSGTTLPLVEKPEAAEAVDTDDEPCVTASPSAEESGTNLPTDSSTRSPSAAVDPSGDNSRTSSPLLDSNAPSIDEESTDDAAGESKNDNSGNGAVEESTLSEVDFQKCKTEMLAADSNNDDQYKRTLDQNEYATLISALEISVGGDSFEKLPKAFKNLFHALQNENEEIPVHGISPIGSPTQANMDHIKSVCTEIFQVIGRLTNPQFFLQECKDGLIKADWTADEKLSKAEYAPFVYRLSFSSLTEEQLSKIKFEDLPNELKVTFELLSNYQESIDISPESLASPTQDEKTTRLQQACNTIYDNAMDDVRSSATTVRNSFVISNLQGLMASKLAEGDERDRLDKAYAEFAEEQASAFTTMVEKGGRQRKLAVIGAVPASGRIDEIENSPCPIESLDGINCMTVSGSFHLIMLNEPNPKIRLELIAKMSQGAIDRGAMQEQLTALDSELIVEGTPEAIAAVKDGETKAPDPSLLDDLTGFDPFDSSAVQPGTVIILICMSIFAFFMVLYGCVYSRRIRHKQKESVVKSQEWERSVDLDGLDDDDDLGLTQEEKQRRSKERELRKSPKPLLLTQAFHLPGFSYGEDFYQYLYGSHPLLGICWHHPLQPVSCKIRLAALLASCSFGISITNIIYLAFTLTANNFNEEALETNVAGLPASVNNGNFLLWTAGAALHAVYDINLLSFSTLSCCVRGGLHNKAKRKENLGPVAVLLNMAAMMVTAMGTTWLREDFFEEEDGDSEVSAAAFGEAFGIEMCSNYFFFFPLIGFLLFSGIFCCCCCKEWFGGRPFEVKMEQREAERKERLRKMHEERKLADEGAEESSTQSAMIKPSSNASNISIRSSEPAFKSSDLVLKKTSIGKSNDDDSSLSKDKDQKTSSTKESCSSFALESSETPNQLKQRGTAPAVPTVQQSMTRRPPPPGTTQDSGRGRGRGRGGTMQNDGRGRARGSHQGRGGRGPRPPPSTMQNGGRGRGRIPAPPGGQDRGPLPPPSIQKAGLSRGRGPPHPGRGISQRAAMPKLAPPAAQPTKPPMTQDSDSDRDSDNELKAPAPAAESTKPLTQDSDSDCGLLDESQAPAPATQPAKPFTITLDSDFL